MTLLDLMTFEEQADGQVHWEVKFTGQCDANGELFIAETGEPLAPILRRFLLPRINAALD
ncbi:hypothetical protein ACGYU5_15315 [Burkholderia pseudomallei]|uniref:hypothetical protein n=1 Tax=Burkholderia pseudomallei TaxID=28450 RepID=UPI00193DBB04|nr:hypothetical protein [Burkholderia pseudomallei]QRM23546.1 hypothetical protein JQX71_04475 [Burkholderia pseudomallei]